MQNPSSMTRSNDNSQGIRKTALSSASNQHLKEPNEFSKFVKDIEDLVKQTTSLTGEDLARAKAELNARIETAKAAAIDVGNTVVQHARQTANVTNEYVHEEPWKAVATGTVIGFLVGALIARRS